MVDWYAAAGRRHLAERAGQPQLTLTGLKSALRCVVYATPAQSGWATLPRRPGDRLTLVIRACGSSAAQPPVLFICVRLIRQCSHPRALATHRISQTHPTHRLPVLAPDDDGDADDDDVRPSPRRLPPSPVRLAPTSISASWLLSLPRLSPSALLRPPPAPLASTFRLPLLLLWKFHSPVARWISGPGRLLGQAGTRFFFVCHNARLACVFCLFMA